MSRRGRPHSESWIFIEPANGCACSLVVKADGTSGIRHPNRPVMAALIAELDAFYCMECGYSGRISGRWAVGIVTARAGNPP